MSTSSGIAAYIREHGGATLSVGADNALTIREYADGYAVGVLEGDGARLPLDSSESMVQAHLVVLAGWYGANHVGAWQDTERGILVLDPVRVLTNKETALKVARTNGQRAIWDFAAKKAIEI